MKMYKKIGLRLFLTLALTMMGLVFLSPQRALATGFPADIIKKATFVLTNVNTITGNFDGQTVDFSGPRIDGLPGSGTLFTYTAASGKFCKDSTIQAKLDYSLYLSSKTIQTNQVLYNIYAGTDAQTCTLIQNLDQGNNIKLTTAVLPPTGTGSEFTKEIFDNIQDSDLKFTDAANVTLTIKDNPAGNTNGGTFPKTLTFTDNKVYDDSPKYDLNGTTPFCGGHGVTIELNPVVGANKLNYLTGDTIPVHFNLYYFIPSKEINKYDCVSYPKDLLIANPSNIATKIFNWDNTSLVSLTGGLKLASRSTESGTSYVEANSLEKPCGGGYEIELASSGAAAGTFLESTNHDLDKPLATCMDSPKQERHILIGETYNKPPPGGGATGTNDACYNSGWEWSWAACPIITAAQTTANGMYNFVEDQLKFCVARNKTDTTTCKGGDSLGKEHDSVHQVWSNFRILVSGLVVILLLVMVISQAIGTGPFDAYTVKKMLPRLVIGVILIQISWPIFSWVINTVDDLGRGLADIMYAPFGGSDALNLNSVMKPFVVGAEVFSWVGIPALAVFAVVAPFIVIGLILTVLVAIFVGFLTLLFRKIIIILALIFVPVALISWMMPNDGLRKYWKLWWDNFIKALMMFPLIVVMIAAGRIFAKIGSGQGGDFVGFFIVLVGFFGPLFILPKTFKWGGTLMQSAGSAISSAGQKGLKKPKEFLGERQKGYSEERRLKSKERVAAGEGFKWRKPRSYYRSPIDKVLSGQWDPTMWGRRAERTLATYKKTGRDAYTEDLGAARIGQQIDWEHLQEGGWVYADDGVTRIAKRGAKDDYLQDVLEGKHTEYIDEDGKNWGKFVYDTDDGRTLDPLGKTRMEKLAALYEMEKLGGATNNRHILRYWEKVQKEAKSNPEAYSDFRRFMSDSVGTMLPKLTDMYKGLASSADAGAGGVAAQHGTEVENMLAELTYNVRVAAPGSKARENAEKMLRTYVGSYLSAAKTDNLRGGMEMGGKRVIKALVTKKEDIQKEILDKIHFDPEDGRKKLGFQHWEIQTGDDIRAALGEEMADQLDKIIGDDGNFDEEAIKGSPAPSDETELHIEHEETPPRPPTPF